MFARRAALALAAAATLVMMGAAPAFADGSHFLAPHTSAGISGFSLTADFKEAGLEAGSVSTITLVAHLDATYQCVNNGNKNPNDPKKTTISGDFSASDEFTAAKNGNLRGSLTLDPPDASDVLDCPNGQRATLTVVSWSDISLHDETTGASIDLAGTFSAGSPIP